MENERDAETTEAYPTTPSFCLSSSLDNEFHRQPRQNLNLNTSCTHGRTSRTLTRHRRETNVGARRDSGMTPTKTHLKGVAPTSATRCAPIHEPPTAPFYPGQHDSTHSHVHILQHPTRNCSCFCFHKPSHPTQASNSLPFSAV